MADEALWERLERSAALVTKPPEEDAKPKKAQDPESERDKRNRKRFLRALDVVAAVFWVYAFIKVFIIDPDRVVLEAIAPGAVGLLNYRIFIYLAIVVLVVLRHRSLILVFAYIAFFPLIVLAWKIPAFFVRRRSWALFLGTLQAVFTALSDFGYNLATKSLALFAMTLILVSDSRSFLVPSAVYIAALMLWSYWRLVRKTLSHSTFLTVQRDKIGDIVQSRPVQYMTTLQSEYRNKEIEVYNQTQLQAIASNISFGILVNKGLYYWAYQLERYRRNYFPSLIFAGVAYVWLFLGTLLGFALINEAIIKLDPEQYTFDSPDPSFLAVTIYSLATLSVQTAGGITPTGQTAMAVQLAAGIAGPLLLVTFGLNFALSYRRERDENALRELVAALKQRAREQDERFQEEWAVGVDEARRRLDELGVGLGWLVTYVTSRVPPEFFDDDAARSP